MSSRAQDTILEKSTKVCAKDLKAYKTFEMPAFTELADALLNPSTNYGHCDNEDLLPSVVMASQYTKKGY